MGAGPRAAFIKHDRDKDRDRTRFSRTWCGGIRNTEIRHAACGVIYTLSVTGEQQLAADPDFLLQVVTLNISLFKLEKPMSPVQEHKAEWGERSV